MSRTLNPHSATYQLFMSTVDNTSLDHMGKTGCQAWDYAVFGSIASGMDVVDRTSAVSTGTGGPFSRDVPTTSIVINSASAVACP